MRFLVQLAKSQKEEMSLAEISQREGVSLPYVRKIFGILRSGGLVRASKGVQGGYSLLKPASEITLREVFEVLGADLQEFSCSDFSGQFSICANHGDCGVRPLLSLLKRKIDELLRGITLSQLIHEEHKVMNALQSKIETRSQQLLNTV